MRLFRETDYRLPSSTRSCESSSGYDLMTEDVGITLSELMPLARFITPNSRSRKDHRPPNLNEKICVAPPLKSQSGRPAVLIKGGNLAKQGTSPTVRRVTQSIARQIGGHDQAIDLLDDEGEVTILRGQLDRWSAHARNAMHALCSNRSLSGNRQDSAAIRQRRQVLRRRAKSKALRAKGSKTRHKKLLPFSPRQRTSENSPAIYRWDLSKVRERSP